MRETKTKDSVKAEQIPYIIREINGTLYTVKIYFWPDSKETARDKVKRLLLKDALSGNFPE